MTRHTRQPARKPRPAAVSTPATPEARAEAALTAGRFREAIELYKDLLKRERRAEWVAALADSYAGRAEELANKGMLPEALVVWRNRASLCGRPLVEGSYIDWLLRAGEHAAALRLLAEGGDLSTAAASDLETRLAATALTAPESALAVLPVDTPLRRHRGAALAAVAACCRGDTVELDEQLRAIPFRSPYRDLRFILKALLLVTSDAAQASELIDRVAPGGPFERLAAVVRAAVLPGSRWLLAMLALDNDGRQLLLDIKGCPENRRTLLVEVAELARLGVPPTAEKVLGLLLQRSRGLPAMAGHLCRRLLPMAERRLREYENAFGVLADVDRECTQALAAESQREIATAKRRWLRASGMMATAGRPLEAALILRHLFDRVVGRDDPADYSEACLGWLQRSVELDPDDRSTHLRLIQIHRQRKDLKAARAALEVAMARFTGDPAVLLEAVETALAGNAFKKAVTLAKRLLELDPINSRVRGLIGQAHLSHARKQLRLHRPEAAGKEIDLADGWLSSASERSAAKLLRGLSATDQAATALLQQAVAELGGKLPAALQVLLECARLGSPPANVLRRAGIDLAGTPSARDVLAVVHVINTLAAADERFLTTAMTTLAAPLKRAAAADFSEAEQIAVCEAWLRWHQISLLRAYAEAGLKRWPGRPVLVYLKTFAWHQRSAWCSMTDGERRALGRAAEQAAADGDQRTLLRIRDLMRPPNFLADDFDEDEDDDDDEDFAADEFFDGEDFSPAARLMLDMLVSSGHEGEIIRMARETLPAGQFRQLERAAGGDRKKLAHSFIDLLAEVMGGPAAVRPKPPRAAPQRPPPAPPAPGPASAEAATTKPTVADDRQKGLFDD
jgi:tetratricopeptide (TPR) repeat protein